MPVIVFKGILLLFTWCVLSTATDVNGKLDFGESAHRKSFTEDNNVLKKSAVPAKFTKTVTVVDRLDNEDQPRFVCGSGGCNKTLPSDDATGRIKTDVLVHIETKLDFDQNKKSKTIPNETPDIPVVVGFKGARLDTTADDNLGLTGVTPVFVPSIYPSAIGISSLNPVEISAFPPSRRTSFYGYSSNNGFSNEGMNINIQQLPPITEQELFSTHIKFRNNGTHLTVPYFEPSFHSHYYGENPPPQHVWYPKNTRNVVNNVEFKTTRPVWSPSQWFNSNNYNHRHNPKNDGQVKTCVCPNGKGKGGLGWYPSSTRSDSNNPGSQINDKLAPLN